MTSEKSDIKDETKKGDVLENVVFIPQDESNIFIESKKVNDEGDDEVPWRVYAAHCLSTWGDNMWWFAGGVFMLHLQDDNLRLTAIYGLVIAASVIMFGATIGNWIDRTKRLTAAKTFLLVQNTCVSLCALLLSGFMGYKDEIDESYKYYGVIIVSILAIILASIARLSSSGVNIIIQKDWIVVIANEDTDKLAKMNSILRTIELTTYMLAPAAGGLLFTYIGYIGTGIFIAVWNIVSVCLEYTLLILIYRRHPKLGSIKKQEDDNRNEDEAKKNVIKDTIDGWKTYMTHPVRNAGLGLAFLFMTVLGFDNITYGYCLLQGVPHFTLGILVGISALIGVLGSLAYPSIRARVGIERTGLIGMFLLISTSSLAVISAFLPGSPMNLNLFIENTISQGNSTASIEFSSLTFEEFYKKYSSVTVFLLGIILARFGLWIVDLTVNQILQERVAEEKRGVINGVQDSLNNSLDLLKCVLVIILPDMETFALLIFLSFVSINIGWLMYALYSRSQRGHLFHFSRLVCLPDTPNIRKRNENQIEGTNEEIENMVKKYEETLNV